MYGRSNRATMVLLRIVGTLFLMIGCVGIVLPLLPTTPFLLLAALFVVTITVNTLAMFFRDRFGVEFGKKGEKGDTKDRLTGVALPSLIGFLIVFITPYSESHNLLVMGGGDILRYFGLIIFISIPGLMMAVLMSMLFLLRIPKEEKLLHEEFESEWEDYCRRTIKKLIPKVDTLCVLGKKVFPDILLFEWRTWKSTQKNILRLKFCHGRYG